MITYKYSAISKSGAKVNGVIEGFNEMDAVTRIKESCDVVLKITEVEEKKKGLLSMEIGGNKLNSKAFTMMCSQFAIILRAGIPIARTVQLIADKTTNKPLKQVLLQVAEDVEAGHGLADSFQERGGKLLPTIFIETLRAGEESGNLDMAFDSMYRHFDQQNQTRGKVKSALTYPVFVILIAIVVVIVLMVKVIPTFTAIFESYDAELPLITRILIGASGFFQKYYPVMILLIIAAIVFYKVYGKTENGRMNFAKIALKLPVLGNIALLSAANQFAANMATLLGSGLAMTKAVTITARVMDNYYLGTQVGKMTGRIEEGHTLGDSMREAACLPDILVDMVSVGEETGEMEATLDTISAYYNAELNQAIKDALDKLEPTVLVGIAAFAGFIVIAIYIAIFEMYGVM